MKKTWIVDGEYYHKAKSKFKHILGEYGYQYEWKERPNYVWRKDKTHWFVGEFDREELPDGTITRTAAKITYNGPESPEMFELIDGWANGHEVLWRLGVKEEKDVLKEVEESWKSALEGAERRRAPKSWIGIMRAEMEDKLGRLKRDLEVKGEIKITDYMYMGV